MANLKRISRFTGAIFTIPSAIKLNPIVTAKVATTAAFFNVENANNFAWETLKAVILGQVSASAEKKRQMHRQFCRLSAWIWIPARFGRLAGMSVPFFHIGDPENGEH
ncbi:hypothetical protein [Thalassospira xiamenensis]|uniref:hypothetical protein n=1 Tax=Thalassospira xiamenensis TaxID=220697 RepID=UPI00115F570C|nr:hypothetical protein [Thalassospira xiamenensis]